MIKREEKSERSTLAGWEGARRFGNVYGGAVGLPLWVARGTAPIAAVSRAVGLRPARGRLETRITQGSVQIVLIFRLLLKITVDWPFHAISMSL